MISHHTQTWYFVRYQWIPVIYDHTSTVLWKTQIVYLDGPSIGYFSVAMINTVTNSKQITTALFQLTVPES